MSQELGLVPKEEDYINPFKKEVKAKVCLALASGDYSVQALFTVT